MVTFHQTIEHKSGVPLGGIGTGSVEIRPDGLFHEWEILNQGRWNPGAPCCGKGKPGMRPEDLIFVVRVASPDGEVVVRYLALREELHNLYSLAWLRSVESIEFDGRFPVAALTYHDKALPVELRAEVFSPFIPLDTQSSGTPGFYVRFTVKNTSDEPLEVSLLGVMRNPVGYDQEKRRPRNRLEEIGEARAVVLGAEGLAENECTTGDMTFAATGGEISYITGAYAQDHQVIDFYRSTYGYKPLSYMHQFREEGTLPNLNAQRQLRYARELRAEKIKESNRNPLLEEFLQYPLFYDKYQIFKLADPEFVESNEFLNSIIENIGELVERNIEFGWCALASKLELAPEDEGESLFTVSWYFPNHISPTGANIGHKYQEWFEGSLDVARFMLDNFPYLENHTLALPEAIYNSSLPAEAADAISGQLSTMTKCTWWTKDGLFGVWEGLGCCGFHTTDITYQGSFPIISLFPDLQKIQMVHGSRFQREDGRVHHFFTPDFSAVDNGFDRVDMNQQFVMLAARDYLWSGDRAYLEVLWPHIIRAMDNTALLDTDGDGLPDTDTRRNTYDAWDFTGCPSYIASLWLGALKAAIRLAEEVGDSDRAKNWQAVYDKGLASFEEKLWNGDYYILWRDGDKVDECCMSDQMSGDWFAAASGWEPILDPERIRKALDSIFTYNFHEGEGLLNATYPPSKERRLAASGNLQADAPWTGIEYTVAALLISAGMVSDGMVVVKDIHNRYLQAGRFFNHVECGNHYYRAMSSWTLLNAFSGFKWDQPTGSIGFWPVIEESSAQYPFFTPIGWGTYYHENSLSGKIANIELSDGEMEIKSLSLPGLGGFDKAAVMVDGAEANCKITECGEGICITFAQPVVLGPGMSLTVVG